ncbi:MAG: hypothetical protein Ct9H300mP7_7080 [Verrucomicrobiota bacterium]|nr:MAG: hypothetical protein Ct9H300mP7_7080 [Verrucomicrobiota bacterium]
MLVRATSSHTAPASVLPNFEPLRCNKRQCQAKRLAVLPSVDEVDASSDVAPLVATANLQFHSCCTHR